MFAPVARVNDFHLCPMQTPAVVPIPHVGGPVVGPGALTVWAGGMPVSVMGDMAICVGPPDVLCMGSPTVMAEGRPVVRISDMTAHMGNVVVGCPNVLVGDSGGAGSSQAATMSAAKAGGSAFVRAECNAKAAASVAAAAAPPPASGSSWVEVEFVDPRGRPVAFQRVEVVDLAGVVGWGSATARARARGGDGAGSVHHQGSRTSTIRRCSTHRRGSSRSHCGAAASGDRPRRPRRRRPPRRRRGWCCRPSRPGRWRMRSAW